RNGHDGRTTREDGRNCGQRSASLEEQEEGDGARANTNTREGRVVEADPGELLLPTTREPQRSEIAKNGECSDALYDKATDTVADVLGGKTRKDLMRSVERCRRDCVPKPHGHSHLNILWCPTQSSSAAPALLAGVGCSALILIKASPGS